MGDDLFVLIQLKFCLHFIDYKIRSSIIINHKDIANLFSIRLDLIDTIFILENKLFD